jgi:hypothetical protein
MQIAIFGLTLKIPNEQLPLLKAHPKSFAASLISL